MGIAASQWHDVIHILQIQAMTKATLVSVKGNCLWYGAMTQSLMYTGIYSCRRNSPRIYLTTIGYHVYVALVT